MSASRPSSSTAIATSSRSTSLARRPTPSAGHASSCSPTAVTSPTWSSLTRYGRPSPSSCGLSLGRAPTAASEQEGEAHHREPGRDEEVERAGEGPRQAEGNADDDPEPGEPPRQRLEAHPDGRGRGDEDPDHPRCADTPEAEPQPVREGDRRWIEVGLTSEAHDQGRRGRAHCRGQGQQPERDATPEEHRGEELVLSLPEPAPDDGHEPQEGDDADGCEVEP